MPSSSLRSLLMLALASCEPGGGTRAAAPPPPPGKPMTLPDGRTVTVSFERIADRACASPEALKHYLETSYWSPGSKAEIESRKALSEGFSTILRVRHGGALDRPVRELFVMRQLGNAWFACNAVLDDNSMDEPVLALCRSLPKPTPGP